MKPRNDVFDNLDSLNIIDFPPAEIADVLSLLEKEDSSTRELSTLILKDAEFATRILRMADPSSKGNRQGIDEVIRAIEVIGRDKIKALLIPVAIFNIVFARNAKNPATIERLREHMPETAVSSFP